MSDYVFLPTRGYRKPWVVEQYLGVDLPSGCGHRWLFARSFATETEAVEYMERMQVTSSAAESWRVRDRNGPSQMELLPLAPEGGREE